MKMLLYIGRVLADQDGTPSFVRHACGFLILVWAYLAFHSGGIPERSLEFGELLAVLYGANAARNAAQSFAASGATAATDDK